jgi:UDP-3-O-[3-hydroxymyristoyl] glucosamine N-acyltransferase
VAFELQTILDLLGGDVIRVVGQVDRTVSRAWPIHEAPDDSAMSYCTAGRANALELIRDSRAGVILCASDVRLDDLTDSGKTYIVVENPRLSFLRLVKELYTQPVTPGIHSTAIIDSNAIIGKNVYIGPYCTIGECEIGDDTVIHAHVHIYSHHVKIGKRCTIYSHTVIGTDGFGYGRNAEDEAEFFPSIGGVIIEDDVDIHCHCNVDRGTLGDTIIGQGTKVDKYNHIGHNVHIGKHCIIMAQSVFSGGAQLGDYVTMGICIAVRDQGIRIGDRAFVGMASVVTKDVPAGTTYIGSPARPIEEHKRILEAMKQVAGVE